MHGTRADVGIQDRAERLAAARRSAPEAAAWLDLLAIALEAAESAPWNTLDPRLQAARPADAPVLHEATVEVDGRAAGRLLRRLFDAAALQATGPAATLGSLRHDALDPLAVLEAAAGHDSAGLDAMAAMAGADPRAFRVVSELAALPMLRGCALAAAPRIPTDWRQGYCPCCGSWPTLVEVRGIERRRRLRCGRCAADWSLPLLRCAFCAETDHRNLAGLVPDGQEHNRRVEGCLTCGGYVKGLTTLGALPDWSLHLEDLATLELDLAAAERGWTRPETSGYAAAVRIAQPDARVSLAGGRLA